MAAQVAAAPLEDDADLLEEAFTASAAEQEKAAETATEARDDPPPITEGDVPEKEKRVDPKCI